MPFMKIENFFDQDSRMRMQYLLDLSLQEIEFTTESRIWLLSVAERETDENCLAILMKMLGAHIDTPEVRRTLTSSGDRLSESSAARDILISLGITAAQDEPESVRKWGIDVARRHAGVDPEAPDRFARDLADLLNDNRRSPDLRWHVALALAELGTETAIDLLLSSGKSLARSLPEAPDAGEDVDMDDETNRFLIEKIGYAVGAAADRIVALGRTDEALQLLETIRHKLTVDDETTDPTGWASSRLDEWRDRSAPSPKSAPWTVRLKTWFSDRFLTPRSPFGLSGLAAAAVGLCVIVGIWVYSGINGAPPTKIGVRLTMLANPNGFSGPVRGESPAAIEISPGDVLRSGDYFQVRLTPESDAHVHVFMVDSSGALFNLYSNRVSANEPIVLSEGRRGFQLDNQPGTETILLLASPEKIPQIENRLATLNRINAETLQTAFPEATVEVFPFRHAP